MNICPKCNEELDYLNIKRNTLESGSFTKEDYGVNYDWNDPEDNDSCEYYCPECEELLFDNEEEAEEFLTINK